MKVRMAFPGWREHGIPGQVRQFPWAGMLLPNLDRSDLWKVNQVVAAVVRNDRPGQCGHIPESDDLPSDPPASTTAPAQVPTLPTVWFCEIKRNIRLIRRNHRMSCTANDGLSSPVMTAPRPPSCWAKTPPHSHRCHRRAHRPRLTIGTRPFLKSTRPLASQSRETSMPRDLVDLCHRSYGGQYQHYNNNPMTANINSAHSGGAVVDLLRRHTANSCATKWGVNYLPLAAPRSTVYQILVTPEGSKNGSEPPADEGHSLINCRPQTHSPLATALPRGFLFETTLPSGFFVFLNHDLPDFGNSPKNRCKFADYSDCTV